MITRRCALGGLLAVQATIGFSAAAQRRSPRGGIASESSNADLQAGPADTPLGPVATSAKWAFVQDFNSGAVLLEKNADEQMAPASLTKLMTLYIVFSRLSEGRLKLDDMLPVSQQARRMRGSKMFLQLGSGVSVEDLIRGIAVASGNDACVALAEAISGSEEQFTDVMNTTAQQLGMAHSHFMNSSGWPTDGHYMSARDTVTLAAAIIRQFPQYYHYAAEKTFKFGKVIQHNRNPLVENGTGDGLMTGHTQEGGFGLVASAERKGRRVIVALNGVTSSHQRAEEGARLMDWAFGSFEDVKLFAAGQTVIAEPVWLGTSHDVAVASADDLVVTLPQKWRSTAKIHVISASSVTAPVAKGAKLAELTVSGPGVPAMEPLPLRAAADVPRLDLPGRAAAVLLYYIVGM